MVGKSGVINELECLCMNAADACELTPFNKVKVYFIK